MKNWLQKAKYFAGLLLLCFLSIQNTLDAQHFIFEYTGPDTIYSDDDCVAVLDWGNTTPTVAPAHPGNGQMINYFDLEDISGGYAQGDTVPPGVQVEVTYLAEDNQGNDSLFTFTIDFVDTIPPVITGIAADITVECDAVPGPDVAVATDNCDDDPAISFDETIIPGTCDHSYFIAWTWTAVDEFGNSSVESRAVTVFDDTDPTFVLPSDITVDCESAGDLLVTGTPMAVLDNCDLNPILYYSDVTTIGYCPHSYTISRTWSVEDDCLNSASGVQLITVQDITNPTFTNEAIDEDYVCDTDTNAESAFSTWLADFGNASASDNCTATAALRWFAAIPGSYDINDTLTYPGITPTELDAAICPSPVMGVYRSKTVDFVVYDLCGNASVSTATFNVVDETAPVFENCPSDITTSNDSGLCETTFDLPIPIITDECANNVVEEFFNISVPITSENPGDPNTAVDSVVLAFTGISIPPSSVSAPVSLSIELVNTDAEATEEYFTILGEDGTILGQTNNALNQCDNSTTSVMIPASNFNDWTTDGTLTITLSPNIPNGQPASAINDICGGSTVNASIDYDSNTPNGLIFQYNINGGSEVAVDPISGVMAMLPVGLNEITYFATDCAGNTSTCVFTITVEDIDAPQIICPSDTAATLGINDDCSLGLEVTLPLPVSVEDNCGFQKDTLLQPLNSMEALLTFSYEPNYLNYIADDKTVVFTGTAANAAGSAVTLKVITTGDADESEEFFTIFSENNDSLGTTEIGQSNVSVLMDTCPGFPVNITTFSIPVTIYNNWAADGTVSFTAISNTDFSAPAPGGPSDGINPFCTTFPPGTPDGTDDGVSSLVMELIYEYVTPSYFADGATIIPTTEMIPPIIAPTEHFNVGVTTVHYMIEDVAGNADTCSFEITVEDNIPPEAVCQATTIFVNPSGENLYVLDPSEIDGGSTDNCSIASMSVDPDTFNCLQQGMAIPVTLTVIDINGNTDSCDVLINVETEQPSPDYAIGLCGNDTLSLFANPPASSGGVVFTYLWNGPNSFTSVEENPQIPNADETYSGSYSITVTGISGCTSVGTVEVSINPSLDIPILNVNSNDLCSDDDLILNTQTYSGTVVTYYWYEGIAPSGSLISTSAVPSLTLVPPLLVGMTNYYVIVEVDGCFSQASDFETVNVTGIPAASVNDPVIDVCEGEMIILGTSETGLNYTYEWTGPNGFSSSSQNPQAITATLADEGTFTLIIYDNNCPSIPVTTDVNVTPTPSTPIITSTGIACEGSEITLSTNIDDGDYYTWTAPDLNSQLTSTNALLITNLSLDDDGDWSVIVTSDGCNSAMSEPFEVVVEPLPTVVPTNDSPVCSSEEVQLSVNSIPFATYQWSGPNGFISMMQNPLAPAVAGIYSVTITSALGCSNSANTEVMVDALPIITALSNDGVPCVTGANDIHLVATIFPPDDGSYTYQWSGPNSFNSTDSLPTLPNGTSVDNGSYTLIVTDGNGCSSAPVTTVVNVSDVPSTPSINAPAQLCETENLLLTTQGYNGTSVVYTWTTPLGTIETVTPSLSIISTSTLNSGNYQVEVTVDGCDSNPSGEMNIEVNPIPNTPVAVSNVPICEGGVIELFTEFIPGATYAWTGPAAFMETVHNPIITDASAVNEGAYSVQVILNGCSSDYSTPVNVIVNPTPDPPSVSNNGPICIDDPDAVLILSVSPNDAVPGASYTWYNAQSGMQVGGPTIALNTSIVDFSNYTEGIYDFYVIAELNGCAALSSVPTSLMMNAIPNNQAFAGDDVQVCNEMNILLNATPPSIGSGNWTQIEGPVVNIVNPDSPNSLISNLESGNVYAFLWSLSNGACQDYDVDEVTVTVDTDTEEAEAGLNYDVCNDTITQLNATLSVTGAIGTWTQSPTQASMGVLISNPNNPNSMVTGLEFDNEYIFTWSLSNAGCGEFSTDDVVITVEENYETAFAGNDFKDCGDGETQLNAMTPGSGNGIWSANDPEVIFVNANDPQTIAQGLQTGVYSFTWTLDNGACGVTTDDIEIEYELAPEAVEDEFSVNYSSSANFNVLNNDLFDGPVVVNVYSNPTNGYVENLGNGAMEYTANSSFTGTDEFIYEICSQFCEDVCSQAIVSLRIGEDVECIAPTIFTPNNDGINDAFIVPCLSTGNYPENTVSIFNQWGDEVFHASPYFNDWKGTYEGQDLPVGTYFFIVKYDNDQPPVSGFLVLER